MCASMRFALALSQQKCTQAAVIRIGVARMGSGIPMQRGGHPEEVARAILSLLSDTDSYTTGSFVYVSGGR